MVSPVLVEPDPAGVAALFAAGAVLDGVFGDVEDLVSALSFAEGAAWVAPDLVGESLVSVAAFEGDDFSAGCESLDFAGSLDSELPFGVLVSEDAFDGDSEPFDSLAAFGVSFFSCDDLV